MKTKPCPFCSEQMYIYGRMGKWICSDHARCGYTLAATEPEIDIFKKMYIARMGIPYMTRRSIEEA
jgi:ribosomal protein L37AE/L43A